MPAMAVRAARRALVPGFIITIVLLVLLDTRERLERVEGCVCDTRELKRQQEGEQAEGDEAGEYDRPTSGSPADIVQSRRLMRQVHGGTMPDGLQEVKTA